MTDGELLDTINGTGWIADLLADFDFDVSRIDEGPVEPFMLPGNASVEMIAGDAAGGAFFLVGTGAVRPVLYVGSEGEGGLIAVGLRDTLALIVGLPSLHDATAVSLEEDGGARMREWLAEADDGIREDWPELDEDRARLWDALGLPAADGLLPALHAAAADVRYRPVNAEGDSYRSMLSTDGE